MDYSQLIQNCDSEIRQGRPHLAAKTIQKLAQARIPRAWRLPIAKIARRAGLYSLGLKILAKLIENENTASPEEVAEYSILLMRAGAVVEGLERIAEVDHALVPEALLYRSFGHFACWEYAEAIPHLEKYLREPLVAYARLVGQANLALALVECRRHEEARRLIQENVAVTHQLGHLQLEANYRSLLAQVELQEGDLVKARREIDSAFALFPFSKTHDHFMVTKLGSILDGLERQSLAPFAELRRLALERCDWVALREADAFSLRVEFREELFQKLIFGTPYESFRTQLLKDFGRTLARTDYVLGPKKSPRFDLQAGTIDGRACSGVGGKSHQLIEILLRDFYEPLRIPSLFSNLFPGEHYSVTTSPGRVRQIIRRTRQWLVDEGIPAVIAETNGFYDLRIEGTFSFKIPLRRTGVETEDIQFQKLRSVFSLSHEFSNRDVCEHLHLSRPAAQNFLNDCIKRGRLQRVGTSKRFALYRFAG